MKREYVVALCVLAVAIFLAVGSGTTALLTGSSPTQRGSGKNALDVSNSDAPSDGDLKMGRTRHSLREAKTEFVTESGLVYMVREEGEGEHPGPNSIVKVHYDGMFEDGTVFDSSRERGAPACFPLDAVIKGWTEGVQLMKPGAKYRFKIPPNLGYGDSGAGATIPPNATLIFEIELISIEMP